MFTRVAGIPCSIEVTAFAPYRCNRRGHIDHWLPDELPEIEWVVCDSKGRRAEWLEKKLTPAERRRIEGELIAASNDYEDY
jgi:hypothetical protein